MGKKVFKPGPGRIISCLVEQYTPLESKQLSSEMFVFLSGGDHTEPIPQVVLLQVLLGQVLEVPLGEGHVGGEVDLGLGTLQGQVVTEVAGLASNLENI